nr:cytochrome bd-I oxidase subunit CydX [Paraburkholderia tropica]
MGVALAFGIINVMWLGEQQKMQTHGDDAH